MFNNQLSMDSGLEICNRIQFMRQDEELYTVHVPRLFGNSISFLTKNIFYETKDIALCLVYMYNDIMN